MSENIAIVTGAAGWLGNRLVRALAVGLPDVPEFSEPAAGREIRSLVLPTDDTSLIEDLGESHRIITGDLRRPESLDELFEGAGGATVFHCAGLVHPRLRVGEFYEVNEKGTANLLEKAAGAGVRRFIHVSSNSPFGCNSAPERTFDESSPFNPYMNYGKSKMLAEKLVGQAAREKGLETVIIRPPWFYGPGQPPRQTLFFTMIREGRAPVVGSGENRRSMAYVDNICQGLLLCEARPGAAGEEFWIADSEPYTMNRIIDTVERLLEEEFGMEVAHKRMKLPSVASEIALLVDKAIQGAGFYQQKVHVLSEMNKTIACSIDKARRVLGYDPKIGLEEGMRRSIDWVLRQGIDI